MEKKSIENIPSLLSKHIDIVKPLFKIYNQPTSIFFIDDDKQIRNRQKGKFIENFGLNEGGPSYEIYIDQNNIISSIKIFEMNFEKMSIDVTTHASNDK